jgi:hypothetical protein
MKVLFRSAIFLMAALGICGPMANAQSRSNSPEQALLQSANHERTTRGLAPLKWSAELAEAAQKHALRMAQENTISHQFPGEPPMQERAARTGAHFSSLAENVAEGPDAATIHAEWMNSPPHRANLLDPHLNSIGIAVAMNNGTLFAVEDLSLAAGGMDIGDQEKVVSGLLQARGLRLLDYTGDARRSCVLDNGYAGSHTPSFVLHYATPDLQTLPDLLEKRIQTGKYHSAVVGACPADSKSGFSSYRVAVLLFE